MFYFSHLIIFTTRFERDFAASECPWIAGKTAIIPIGSNIPVAQGEYQRSVDVCYFGNIAPGKGIESFLSVCSRLPKGTTISLIGGTSPSLQEYWEDIVARCRTLGVSIRLNEKPQVIASLLSSARIALLPFPDGISMRRGSALAAMANGALVVTTAPARDAYLFTSISHCCASEEEMVFSIQAILSDAPDNYNRMQSAAREYAEQFAWPRIARLLLDSITKLECRQSESK
jgi:glycosyltransferase involved in cell wall biosynthesis